MAAHALFQTPQITLLLNPKITAKPSPPSSSFIPRLPFTSPWNLKVRCPARVRVSLSSSSSSSMPARDGGGGGGAESVAVLERCYGAAAVEVRGNKSIERSMRSTSKSSSSSGTMTLVKKISAAQTAQQIRKKPTTPELSTGDGGGDSGKKISHGGGDGGGDDGGDDDNYFDDFDEDDDGGDDGGLFRRRLALPELFDREFVNAVMSEWMKTIADLPAGFQQACEMGLISTAQMVKLLAINARPTTERAISRILPQGMSRAFVGRMLADPAFLYRLLLEQVSTIGCSVWWEMKNRKDRIKQEWDLALINVLTASACNAIVVWSLAPCRSYGNTFKYDLQNTLQKLPNNIFESSYYLREFDLQKRIQSFLYKAAELSVVGMTAGAAQGALSSLCANKRDQRVSVTIPSLRTNALGYGAFLGVYSNFRYQLLCGIDRTVTNYFDVIGVALFLSTGMRILNVQLGEASRLAWLGVQVDPIGSDSALMASEANSKQSSGWPFSKNVLGLLGIKQGTEAPKPRRKKIVRRKVTPSK